jgi:hypothetical protein
MARPVGKTASFTIESTSSEGETPASRSSRTITAASHASRRWPGEARRSPAGGQKPLPHGRCPSKSKRERPSRTGRACKSPSTTRQVARPDAKSTAACLVGPTTTSTPRPASLLAAKSASSPTSRRSSPGATRRACPGRAWYAWPTKATRLPRSASASASAIANAVLHEPPSAGPPTPITRIPAGQVSGR